MTWHLKDRELEKKLIEIALDFVDSLNESLKLGEYEENSWTYRVLFGPYEDCYKFEMHVYDDELEELPEYNPNGWNDYPKVTPPYDVMMRVETHTGQGYKLFYNHLGDGDFWCDPNFLVMSKAFSDDVTRFRPWED